MADLTNLKIPIFAGINDQARTPTQSLAGNGSHVVKTINDIIDRLQPPAEVWDDYTGFYLDTVGGNDSNDGSGELAPLKTWAAVSERLQAKKLPRTITIYIKGELTETLDFSDLWGDYTGSWIHGLPQITLRSWLGDLTGWQYTGSGELLRINSLSPIKIYFDRCSFTATDDALLIRNNNGFVYFAEECSFDSGEDNYESILHLEDCQLVWLASDDEAIVFNNSGASAWAGIVANNRTQLWVDGIIFNNLELGVGAYADSTVVNYNAPCIFNDSEYNWDIADGSSVSTNYPDTALSYLVTLNRGGRINRSQTQTFFFPSLSPSTIAPLYANRKRERLQYVRVDGNLTGATFQIRIDGVAKGNPLDETSQQIYFDGSINTKMYGSSQIELVVTGNPTNVSLQLELMEF